MLRNLMDMFRRVRCFFHPERFQGWGRTRRYFEGWYFKLVDASGTNAYAVIPGIAMDEQGKRHAFIQVLDGKRRTAAYHRFPFESFRPTPTSFCVEISGNHFSNRQLTLDLPELKGTLRMHDAVPWPAPFYSPGIMGPYAFAPFMECYHGIVSMDHSLSGSLNTPYGLISFDNGRGYTEKDWGRSFPAAYVWMQSNHFSIPGTSFKCSVARIPWVTRAFTGFIAGLWKDGQLHRFTTYNRTRLLRSDPGQTQVTLLLENPAYRLQVTAHRDTTTALSAPIRGLMEGRIEESMTAEIHIRLEHKKQGLIWEDTGRHAGLEVAGDLPKITV